VKALHFDCFSGISGDMTLAALIDAGADAETIRAGLDSLGLPIRLEIEKVRKGGSGKGMVKCAHGLMPIPAPGTMELLKGVPLAESPIKVQAELTTPTGAAILTSVVQEWVEQPVMTVERIGQGAGRREFLEQPNLLRILVGTVTQESAAPPLLGETDRVWVLETNLDDLPAEVIGYCYERLLASGALDVWSTPVVMKKNRPGVMLSVLAPEAVLPQLQTILFRETTTFGIRRYPVNRVKLHRRPCTVTTAWGPVQGKLGWLDGEAPLFSPEFEDCTRVAREHGVPLRSVYAAAQRAYQEQSPAQ
jgi:uncharacterized protein (TIGR00299 family) protein